MESHVKQGTSVPQVAAGATAVQIVAGLAICMSLGVYLDSGQRARHDVPSRRVERPDWSDPSWMCALPRRGPDGFAFRVFSVAL